MDQNDLYYIPGSWNVICDSCGKKIKASEAKQRWDGLIVCPDDFEMRQPQDFVKARADKISVPFTRPRSTDVFIGPFCTLKGLNGIAGLGVAGCSIAGYIGDDSWKQGEELLNDYAYAIAGIAIAGIAEAGRHWSMQPNQ